jgi:hypothetical protein
MANGLKKSVLYTYGIADLFFYFGYRIDDRQVMRMQEEIYQSQVVGGS